MKLSHPNRLWLAAALMLPACEGKDQRQLSTGTELRAPSLSGDANPGGAGAGAGAGGGGGGGGSPGSGGGPGAGGGDGSLGGGGGDSSKPLGQTAKTLEQCTAEGKAWNAVVNSGAEPAKCGEPLTNWCCTRDEILARFPTMRDLLVPRFDKTEQEGYKLYHCSSAEDKKTTFHFAQIGPGSVRYRTHFVTGVFPVDTGRNGRDGCAEVKTDDLRVASDAPPAEPPADPAPAPAEEPEVDEEP